MKKYFKCFLLISVLLVFSVALCACDDNKQSTGTGGGGLTTIFSFVPTDYVNEFGEINGANIKTDRISEEDLELLLTKSYADVEVNYFHNIETYDGPWAVKNKVVRTTYRNNTVKSSSCNCDYNVRRDGSVMNNLTGKGYYKLDKSSVYTEKDIKYYAKSTEDGKIVEYEQATEGWGVSETDFPLEFSFKNIQKNTFVAKDNGYVIYENVELLSEGKPREKISSVTVKIDKGKIVYLVYSEKVFILSEDTKKSDDNTFVRLLESTDSYCYILQYTNLDDVTVPQV